MTTPLPHYTGNKNIPGLLHLIINNIPECDRIVEPFCGSAIISYTLSSVHSILNDMDPKVTYAHVCAGKQNSTVITGNGTDLIHSISAVLDRRTFIYCDPPYRLSSRASGKELYKFEFTEADHIQLLTAVRSTKNNCMISHPRNEMYDTQLKEWRRIDKPVSYNGAITIESIYMNYPEPERLASYEYLGIDCWDRQRIKRMKGNFIDKLKRLPPQQRNMLLTGITEEFDCKTRTYIQKCV